MQNVDDSWKGRQVFFYMLIQENQLYISKMNTCKVARQVLRWFERRAYCHKRKIVSDFWNEWNVRDYRNKDCNHSNRINQVNNVCRSLKTVFANYWNIENEEIKFNHIVVCDGEPFESANQ
jgi:hypothetical protein